ncbi:MAG TPA: hypothetical protein VGR35_13875 [Tepidisphaeraceae bacterium]|nr:hypothetical protein [Tepidisphaeraceae bacterium]
MKTAALVLLLLPLLLPCVTGCNHASKDPRAAADDTRELAPPPRPYLLHLPGIGGHRSIDDMLTQGLVQGGMDADVEIYDWTDTGPGLSALYSRPRHHQEAGIVARKITDRFRADPRTRIYLSGHSGGTGIALWALERLPPDVKIESLLMLASAMSPTYDLSPALRHVRAKAYALHSPHDPVLGIGTRMFRTIDGIKSDAAGRVGFAMPPGADPKQYEKLVQISYDPAWIPLSHIGDHVGPMMRPFAREILSPLLRTGVLRQLARTVRRPAPAATTTATVPE